MAQHAFYGALYGVFSGVCSGATLQAHVALGVFRFQNFVGATTGASIIPNTLVGVPSYIYSILAPKTLFLAVE